jgi:hypothetical protein
MIPRISTAVLAALASLMIALPALSQTKDKKAPTDMQEDDVYVFGKAVEANTLYEAAGGGGMTVKQHNYAVTVKAVYGGEIKKDLILVGAKDHPLAKLVTEMKSGDYLTLTSEKRYNHTYITKLSAYDIRPGEDQPGVFVFAETSTQKGEGGADVTAVKLYKMGRVANLVVPNVMDKASGKMVPDPNLSAALGKFTKGDTVEVATAGSGPAPSIRTIELYCAPQEASVSKLTEAEVPGGKTPAVEVTIGGAATTILVPGKTDAKGAWAPDPALSSAVKQFKEGAKVIVRFRKDDDGKNWLKEIKKAPDAPPAPPKA